MSFKIFYYFVYIFLAIHTFRFVHFEPDIIHNKSELPMYITGDVPEDAKIEVSILHIIFLYFLKFDFKLLTKNNIFTHIDYEGT